MAKRITSRRDSVYYNGVSDLLPPLLDHSLQPHIAGPRHLHLLESPNVRLSYVVIVDRGWVYGINAICFVSFMFNRAYIY